MVFFQDYTKLTERVEKWTLQIITAAENNNKPTTGRC